MLTQRTRDACDVPGSALKPYTTGREHMQNLPQAGASDHRRQP